eukprot:m.10175 g.10175  ORF g.10175 m.10175 type:complete len:877 (-) comp2720_c0_seq1:63-2693(-)
MQAAMVGRSGGMAAVASAGAMLNERYRVDRLLGAGSYGSCWLAVDTKGTGQPLRAVKQVYLGSDAKMTQKVVQEAKLLMTLKHPHVLRARETFMGGGVFNIVTDFCDDGDLSLAIDMQRGHDGNGPYFEEKQVLDWILQLALALQYIHERHILHRDIKTKNIFLSKTPRGQRLLKLGDFGIARTLMDTAELATSMAGTPLYMSPECLQCHGCGPKSDQWAFGVVIWEVCLLHHPFQGQSLMGLLWKICEGDLTVELPNTYSNDLATLVTRLVRREPVSRPSAREVLATPIVHAHGRATVEALSARASPAMPDPDPDQSNDKVSVDTGTRRLAAGKTTTTFAQQPHSITTAPPRTPPPTARDGVDPTGDDATRHDPPSGAPAQFLSPRERAQRRKEAQAAARARELTQLAVEKRAENNAKYIADRHRLHIGSRDSSHVRPAGTPHHHRHHPPHHDGASAADTMHSSSHTGASHPNPLHDTVMPHPPPWHHTGYEGGGGEEGGGMSAGMSRLAGVEAETGMPVPRGRDGALMAPRWPPPSRDGPAAVWAGGSTLNSTVSSMSTMSTMDAAGMTLMMGGGEGAGMAMHAAARGGKDAMGRPVTDDNMHDSGGVDVDIRRTAADSVSSLGDPIPASFRSFDMETMEAASDSDTPMQGSPTPTRPPPSTFHDVRGHDSGTTAQHGTDAPTTSGGILGVSPPSRTTTGAVEPARVSVSPMTPDSINEAYGTAGSVSPPADGSDDDPYYSDDFEDEDEEDLAHQEAEAEQALADAMEGCLVAAVDATEGGTVSPQAKREAESWEEAAVGTRATQLQRLESDARMVLGDDKFDEVHTWILEARVAKMNEAEVQQHIHKHFVSSPADVQGCFKVDQLVYSELFAE